MPKDEAHHGIRQRGENQRSAHGGSDADLLLVWGVPENYGDKGDSALGQRGTERGEQRTHSGGPETQATAYPFDAVHKELAREVDDVSGNEKREQREQHVQQAGREPRHGGCAPGMERHPPVKGLAGHDAGETPETPVARTMALSAPSMLMRVSPALEPVSATPR